MLFYCLLTFFPRKMSNILDPDQARCSVSPDLGPKLFEKR